MSNMRELEKSSERSKVHGGDSCMMNLLWRSVC